MLQEYQQLTFNPCGIRALPPEAFSKKCFRNASGCFRMLQPYFSNRAYITTLTNPIRKRQTQIPVAALFMPPFEPFVNFPSEFIHAHNLFPPSFRKLDIIPEQLRGPHFQLRRLPAALLEERAKHIAFRPVIRPHRFNALRRAQTRLPPVAITFNRPVKNARQFRLELRHQIAILTTLERHRKRYRPNPAPETRVYFVNLRPVVRLEEQLVRRPEFETILKQKPPR